MATKFITSCDTIIFTTKPGNVRISSITNVNQRRTWKNSTDSQSTTTRNSRFVDRGCSSALSTQRNPSEISALITTCLSAGSVCNRDKTTYLDKSSHKPRSPPDMQEWLSIKVTARYRNKLV
ncbi:unnamed protein product [Heterobilharzia americana]|nr:unnamed protein product [Heterobilharzia americana]